uniref:DMRT-like family C1a n=2 Tax=Rattus norvegicus TaxID=10116 RepID=A0ABK0LDS4_RAT
SKDRSLPSERQPRGGGVLLQVWSPGFWSLLRLAPGPPPLGAAPPHPSGPGLQYRPRPAEALRGGASAFPQQSGRRARRRRLRPLPCPLPGPWGLRAAAWDSRAGGCGCSRRPPQRPRRRHGPRGLAASARSGRPPNARGRASPPRVPASWASQSRREVRKAVSAVSASKKEQATRVKKHVVRRQKGTMAAAPKSHVHVKKLTVEEGVRTGKNSVHQLQAQVDTATQQESSQGPVLLSQLPETTSVPYTPETMGQQLTVSLSGEPYGPSAMPSMCPSLILQPCATTDPMLLQPQGSSASNQASVSATLEWQEMLEAAEALLALKNSSQTRHQPCGMPGTAGERGLQLPNPSMPPRPASSGSLPSGHLDCMSLLT